MKHYTFHITNFVWDGDDKSETQKMVELLDRGGKIISAIPLDTSNSNIRPCVQYIIGIIEN